MNIETKSPQTLGNIIKNARKAKNYSQRELAKLSGIDYTYLSKIENDKTDYPPTERVIRLLARELDLNGEELIFLTGRIPENVREYLIENYHTMPIFFKSLRANPELIKRLLNKAS